jgi:hypothetical protein
MNVKMLDQTPGIEEALFGISAQRSGLEKKKKRGHKLFFKNAKRTKPT